MLFLLNNLLNLFSFGKYFLKSLKNSFPMFVETWLLKGNKAFIHDMLLLVFHSFFIIVHC